ncbi:Rhodanese-related sulfurtransferase [Amphibacillus marinus]|uniref:Rhodanese-related sulfurtransferase n=1 Tax=Amphibacillus marinus TaxID=872970 RepID=A0A1H8IWS7_9BACI|nr:rhodanese-like domain-containing protein [Amphibacillus marinus]SEN72496.1 Rhodanese-related sulfurtransferase [Amphibacillus marinus]
MESMTAKELYDRIMNRETLNIIDVREADEVAEGKIAQAQHIAMGQIPNAIADLNKNEHYYIICLSGSRSAAVCHFLADQGFETTNIEDGMLAWQGETA